MFKTLPDADVDVSMELGLPQSYYSVQHITNKVLANKKVWTEQTQQTKKEGVRERKRMFGQIISIAEMFGQIFSIVSQRSLSSPLTTGCGAACPVAR